MEYFAHLGYPCPSQCNPADHLIDLVSTDYDSTVTAARDSARIERLVGAWTRHTATAAAALSGKRPAGAIRGNQIEAITLRGRRPAPSAAAATTATATAATSATTTAATSATSATATSTAAAATSTAAAAARAAPLPRNPITPRSRLDLVDLVTRSRRSRHPTTPRSRPPAPSRQTRRCSGRRSPLVRFGHLVRRSWCQNVRWPLTEHTTNDD
jgi:hypothetical protein